MLPAFPPDPTPAYVLFSPQQWQAIWRALKVIYAGLEAALQLQTSEASTIMAELDDLKSSFETLIAAQGAYISTVNDAFARLQASTGLTQAQKDEIAATQDEVTAAESALTTAQGQIPA